MRTLKKFVQLTGKILVSWTIFFRVFMNSQWFFGKFFQLTGTKNSVGYSNFSTRFKTIQVKKLTGKGFEQFILYQKCPEQFGKSTVYSLL